MKTVIKWDMPFLVRFLRKYLLVIVIFSCIFTSLGTIITSYLNKPTYTSSVQMSQNDNNVAQISSYTQFINTDKFKSLLNKQIKQSKKKQFLYSIQINSDTNSTFFTFQAVSRNAGFSQFVANEAMIVFIKNVSKYLSGANVTVVSKAILNKKPNSINFTKTIIGLFLVGFMLVTSLMIVREIFGGTVNDRLYIHDVYGLDKLGELELKDK